MIYTEKFGQHVRLGNFIFHFAANLALSIEKNVKAVYPSYYLWDFLETPPKIIEYSDFPEEMIIRPKQWGYSKEEHDYIRSLDYSKDIVFALNHFRQSELWFEIYENEVRDALSFSWQTRGFIWNLYRDFLENSNNPIAIGIRLGDFVGHGDFYQIPYEWYIKALKQMPNWQKRSVIVFSDDIHKAKEIFRGYNFYYAAANNTHTHADNFKHYHSPAAIEQFVLGTMIPDWIIGNSTFSWWQAWLSKTEDRNVFHCGEVFSTTGTMKDVDISNYYPKDWRLIRID